MAILTGPQMLTLVLGVWRRTPLLRRLQAARRLSGEAQHRELISILQEFEQTTRTGVRFVPTGAVQAARGAGNLSSHRIQYRVLQIETQVLQNTQTLLNEITHELPFYYTGIDNQDAFGESGIHTHEFLEMILTDPAGEAGVMHFLSH